MLIALFLTLSCAWGSPAGLDKEQTLIQEVEGRVRDSASLIAPR